MVGGDAIQRGIQGVGRPVGDLFQFGDSCRQYLFGQFFRHLVAFVEEKFAVIFGQRSEEGDLLRNLAVAADPGAQQARGVKPLLIQVFRQLAGEMTGRLGEDEIRHLLEIFAVEPVQFRVVEDGRRFT